MREASVCVFRWKFSLYLAEEQLYGLRIGFPRFSAGAAAALIRFPSHCAWQLWSCWSHVVHFKLYNAIVCCIFTFWRFAVSFPGAPAPAAAPFVLQFWHVYVVYVVSPTLFPIQSQLHLSSQPLEANPFSIFRFDSFGFDPILCKLLPSVTNIGSCIWVIVFLLQLHSELEMQPNSAQGSRNL